MILDESSLGHKHIVDCSMPDLQNNSTTPPKKSRMMASSRGACSFPWHCLGIAWPPHPARTLITLFSDANEQLASERTTLAWWGGSKGDGIVATWCVVSVNSKRQRRGQRGRTQAGGGIILKLPILIGSRCSLKSDFDVWPNLLNCICQRCCKIPSHHEVKRNEDGDVIWTQSNRTGSGLRYQGSTGNSFPEMTAFILMLHRHKC